jgi:hypothetical protein
MVIGRGFNVAVPTRGDIHERVRGPGRNEREALKGAAADRQEPAAAQVL